MQICQPGQNAIDNEIIRHATRIVKNGGVVLYPSDTIYGLGCDPFNLAALERIVELKGRTKGRGFLLLIPDLGWIKRLSMDVSPGAMKFCNSIWPGPVTILLRASTELPKLVSGDKGIVGLRFPDSPFLTAWLNELQQPLVSTSANFSGQSPTGKLRDLEDQFGSRVDLFLDSGDLVESMASTVVDYSAGFPKIIRKGEGLIEVKKILVKIRQE